MKNIGKIKARRDGSRKGWGKARAARINRAIGKVEARNGAKAH